jgi:hypothetical protein
LGRADLHIHSIYSIDGTDTIPELLEYAAYRDNLDVIAVTDHDDIRGGLEAAELAGNYGIEAIPGSEVTTLEGHLLALFIEKDIPPRRPLIETIVRVGEMGGLCIVPHPNSPLANSLTHEHIRQAASYSDSSQYLVGMEVFTGCLLVNSQTSPLRSIAHQYHLCEISASDAHVRELIGSGLVRFPANSVADLRRALVNRQVTPIIRFNPTGTQVAVSWTKQAIAKRRNLFDYAREIRNYRANQKRNSKNA